MHTRVDCILLLHSLVQAASCYHRYSWFNVFHDFYCREFLKLLYTVYMLHELASKKITEERALNTSASPECVGIALWETVKYRLTVRIKLSACRVYWRELWKLYIYLRHACIKTKISIAQHLFIEWFTYYTVGNDRFLKYLGDINERHCVIHSWNLSV